MPWEKESSDVLVTSFSTIKEVDILSISWDIGKLKIDRKNDFVLSKSLQVVKVFKGNCNDFQLSILRHLPVLMVSYLMNNSSADGEKTGFLIATRLKLTTIMSNVIRGRTWYNIVHLSEKEVIHLDDVYCTIDGKEHFSIRKISSNLFLLGASINNTKYLK